MVLWLVDQGKCQKQILLKFCKVTAMPVVLHGSECWAFKNEQMSGMKMAEMWLIREWSQVWE
jgi:hypothetical protein